MRSTLLLLTAVCAAAMAANPFQPVARGYTAPGANAADFRVGFWDIAPFDPLFGEPPLSDELRIGAYPGDGTGYYLVQFDGPVRSGQARQLEAVGAGFLGFHSRLTAFVKMNSAVAGAVSRLGFVRWVGLYQPGYKFWTGTLAEQEFGRVAVSLFYEEDLDAAAQELGAMGLAVVRTGVSEYMKVIEVDCSRADLARIARLGWVMNIEEWYPAEPENEQCQWVAQTWSQNQRRVWAQGVYGEGEILGWIDGQVYPNHYAFLDPALPITDTGEFPTHRKLVVVKKYPPARLGSGDSHGTHTGGTIAGNDSVNGGSNANDGHAKSARLVQLSPIPQPPGNDFTVPLNMITNDLRNPELRPKTISASWWTLTKGQYTNAASTWDLFSWKNKDIQTVKSCGNQGHTQQYQVTEPGNSKSIISAASLQNGANSTVLSSYSSSGPAPDGRIKPDISIPGEAIMSAQSGSSNGYVSMSGTSMAAPATNGAIGLLRNYLRKGFYPSGAANPADTWGYVSSAVLKAMLFVSADPNVESYVVPSDHIGWGRVNLDSVMFFSTPSPDARKLLVDDDTFGLATGEYVEYEFMVTDSTLHLRAGVVWTDTAAAAGANPALINNLDCQLTAPNADIYKGSVYSAGLSVRNPTQPFNTIDPQEMFRVANPGPGTWTLRVTAQNVVTARQPYAVVVTGAIGAAARHDVGVAIITAPTGMLESGAVVMPACTVRNYGSFSEDYSVRMKIGAGYDTMVTVTGHAAGTSLRVAFPAWTANQMGIFPVVCSTELAGDANPANDAVRDSITVRGVFHDVGLVAILAPADTVDSGAVIIPQIIVQNFGTRPATDFPIFMHIGTMYAESAHATLPVGAVDTVALPPWTATRLGAIWMTAFSSLPGDMNRSNDTLRDTVIVWPQTGVSEATGLPAAFALDNAVPTLFSRATQLRFALPRQSPANVAIYNTAGQIVRILAEGVRPAGYHRLTWDGRDDAGRSVASGIYYCRLSADDFRAMKKLVKLD